MTDAASEAELRPAGEGVPLDWAAVARHLRAHGLAADDDVVPRQFRGGLANLNYRIAVDGRPAVLRRPPPGELPPGANDMRREHRILSRLWRGFALAPRAFHLCEDAGVIGVPFFVMDYRPGRVIGGTLPPDLVGRPGLGAQLGEALIAVLGALHQVDPRAVDLDTLGRPEGFLARSVDGWIKRAAAAVDGPLPAAARATADWLRAQPLPERTPTLLHNDFKLDNMILDRADLRPVAVVDWDQGTRGDPLLDLAILLSYWSEPGDPPAVRELGQMPAVEAGFPSRRAAAERYAQRTGRDLGDFRCLRTLASFKLAVIFQQLGARWVRGTIDDPRYARFPRLAQELHEFAHEVAQGRLF